MKLKVTITATEEIDPNDWEDEFRDDRDVDPEDEVDEAELKAYAIMRFREGIMEGDTELQDDDAEVSVEEIAE